MQSVTRALGNGLAAITLIIGPLATSPALAADGDISLTCFPHAPSDELRFDDTWGDARSGGRGHQGTDIMSPKELEVLAVADGTVAGLSDGPRSGYYIRLIHGGGWESWYMHLANDTTGSDDGDGGEATAYAPGLTVGDRVRAGQVIGYVGDSGNAEWAGSHTHFELHIGDRPVNPYPYLVDVAARIDHLYEVTAPIVAPPARFAVPTDLESSLDLGLVWGELVASPGVECLTSHYQDTIQHVFGQLPGEGVLLTGVVAR